MPWNAPQEYVDQFANALVEYLKRRGERTQSEIDRTHATCRDFARFLGKDIHDASSKDYTTFKRRRVVTVQDEDDYQQMLDDIKAFCRAMPRHRFAPAQGEKTGRQKVTTSRIQPSDEIMAFLLSPEGKGSDTVTPSATPCVGDPDMTPPKFDQHKTRHVDIEAYNAIAAENTPFRKQSDDLHVKDLFDDANFDRPAGSVDDDSLRPPVASVANIPPGFLGKKQDDNNFSAFFSPLTKDDDRKFELQDDYENPSDKTPNPALDDSIARQVARNDMSTEFLAEGSSPANNELLRGVSGVDYNFSQSSLEIMRKGERNKARQDSSTGAPIDESLIYSNFRPYTVDEKYLIDIPNPDPAAFRPYAQSFVTRRLIPAIPTLVGLALVCLGWAISAIVGILFLLLTAAVIAESLPILRPPARQTPVATANAFFLAQSMRAYAIGLDLCAVPKDAAGDIDIMAIWQPVVPPWKPAILNRLRPKREIQTRIVAGSDAQNSVVVLCTKGDDYYLLPLVRIDNAWLTTSIDLPKHTIKSEEPSKNPF